jgi:hypothetical protein
MARHVGEIGFELFDALHVDALVPKFTKHPVHDQVGITPYGRCEVRV